MLMAVVEQGSKTDAVLDAGDGTINSMTKTVVFFLLQTGP